MGRSSREGIPCVVYIIHHCHSQCLSSISCYKENILTKKKSPIGMHTSRILPYVAFWHQYLKYKMAAGISYQNNRICNVYILERDETFPR